MDRFGMEKKDDAAETAAGVKKYFAVAAAGTENIAAEELRECGAFDAEIVPGGVWFRGDLATLYRANLHVRTATRITQLLRDFAAIHQQMLYSQVRRVRWEDYLNPQRTFAVFSTMEGQNRRQVENRLHGADFARKRDEKKPGIHHSQFASLKIKDAIVDRLRQEQGARPNIDPENPDIRVDAHFAKGRCLLCLDSSGKTLNQRGYRVETGEAPLRETLAAAIIKLSGWDGTVPLWDPMCGSGTLVIEAAMLATRRAAGGLREEFGFLKWPDYDPQLWGRVLREAQDGIQPAAAPIFASDLDAGVVEKARRNAARAGVEKLIQFSVGDAREMVPPCEQPGIVVTNPPYGERIGEEGELKLLYRRLTKRWKESFARWRVCVLSGNPKLEREIGLPVKQRDRLYNGGIESRLLRYELRATEGEPGGNGM